MTRPTDGPTGVAGEGGERSTTSGMSLEEFKARISSQLDDHFDKFADVIAAINAGFTKQGPRT